MDSVICLPNTLLISNSNDTLSKSSSTSISTSDSSELNQWKDWFLNHAPLPIPNPCEDPAIESFIQKSSFRELEMIDFLKLQYIPSSNALLNEAQLKLLSCFLELPSTANDAVSIAYLLRDYFLCTSSTPNCDYASYSGEYFRLLLLFFNPPLSFQLDSHFPSWERSIQPFLIDPTSFLTPQQIRCFIQHFQQFESHSIIWFFLAVIHTLSFHYSQNTEIDENAFDDYLRHSLTTFASSFSALHTMSQFLPSLSQDSITCTFRFISSQPLFALPLSFQYIVGPVITTESRFKQFTHPYSMQTRCFTLLDIRKNVAIKNELINQESGYGETTLHSSISPTQRSSFHYYHIPYSSYHSESNTYFKQTKDTSSPIILLADSHTEANMVALLLQKASKQLVLIAETSPNEPHDFTKLLDILLSTDDTISKLPTPYTKTIFPGWRWWRGWKNESENETSSSEYYRSYSLEEEKRILVQPEKRMETCQKHTKEYFNEIHRCLDKIVLELNEKKEKDIVPASILSIVKPLIYVHEVECIQDTNTLKSASAIEAIHRSAEVTESSQHTFVSVSGPLLLVLTNTHLLLLQEDRFSKEVLSDQQDNEKIAMMIDTFQKSGLFSNDDAPLASNEELSYWVQVNIPLADIQGVNILVDEESRPCDGMSQQHSIHIQLESHDDLLLQVDYSIFIINEIMKRIGNQ